MFKCRNGLLKAQKSRQVKCAKCVVCAASSPKTPRRPAGSLREVGKGVCRPERRVQGRKKVVGVQAERGKGKAKVRDREGKGGVRVRQGVRSLPRASLPSQQRVHLSARFLYKIFPLTSLFLSVTVGSLYMDEEMIDFELDEFNNEAAERRGNPRAPGRRQGSPKRKLAFSITVLLYILNND